MKPITFDPLAAKQFRELGSAAATRIEAKLVAYATGGEGDVVAYRGRPGAARLRVGDWRVVFTETDDRIVVHLVGHRRDVYE